jgi:hypothetical protein
VNQKPVNLNKLKKLLQRRRREILKQVAHWESEREELGQRFIEPNDEDIESLKHRISELFAS